MAITQAKSNVVIFGADGDVLNPNAGGSPSQPASGNRYYVKNVTFSGTGLSASPIVASLGGLDESGNALVLVPLNAKAITDNTWAFLFNEALLVDTPKFNSNDANLKMYVYLEQGINL